MIGFPGAHYDYSEWVTRYNQRVPIEPVGLRGRPAWDQA
jgi:gluconate 2-dehydrogenase gamma chain